jgi:subtilase family serine protease
MATAAVTIPAGTVAGSYYLIAYADSWGTVAEGNETNNQVASALQVTGGGTADLVVAAFTAPGTLAAGATANVTDTTKNQGSGAAGTSITTYYLSTKTTWDTTAQKVGSRNVAGLAGGSSDMATAAVTIPAGTVAGSYYLIAYADSWGTVAEGNESNNQVASALRVTGGP